MAWLELKLITTKSDAEALEALLWDLDAVSVTMTDAQDEPLFEPGVGETPLWHNLVLTGLFEGTVDSEALQIKLQQAWTPNELPKIHSSILEEQDWVRSWLDDFKPMRFGSRLWICPSWWLNDSSTDFLVNEQWSPSKDDAQAWSDQHRDLLQDMQAPDQIVIKLDPGLAFGTGTHPTTALCLQWLDSQNIETQQLIDFGCGSGILGIAALLLGAKQVVGIDNDPQALSASTDNCDKNQLPHTLFPVYLPDDFQALQLQNVDGVMANILAGTLIELCEQIASLVSPSGWILLSGILAEQSPSVIEAFTPWFEDFDVCQLEDWVRISAKRKTDFA